MSSHNGFKEEIWHEIQPVLRHFAVAMILLVSFLIIGVVVEKIKTLLPTHDHDLYYIEMGDLWLATATFWMFGIYNISFLLIRLSKALLNELNRTTERG